MVLDSVLEATEATGAKVVSEEHNLDNITPGQAKFDAAEYTQTKAGAKARANLNKANGKVSIMSVLETPWHGLGVVIDRAATSAEALQFANLAGWKLEKVPMYAQIPGEETKWVLTDKFGVVRRDTNDYLGCVSKMYHVVPNEDAFSFMDAVIEGGARYETAGALGKGERVWMLAQMPKHLVIGSDEVKNYILFTTAHDGSQAIHVYPTNVRTVCQNTYRMAERGREGGLALRHTSGVGAKIKMAQRALGLAFRQIDEFEVDAKRLAAASIDPVEYFSGCLDDIVAVTVAGQRVTEASIRGKGVLGAIVALQEQGARATAEVRYEQVLEKRREVLSDILNRYESERNGGNPAIAGSAWAAWNSVTEYADYGLRYAGDVRQKAESRFESAVSGRSDAIKQSAFDRALMATSV